MGEVVESIEGDDVGSEDGSSKGEVSKSSIRLSA